MTERMSLVKEYCPRCDDKTNHYYVKGRGWVCVACNKTGDECFISTAICQNLNLSDDCMELNVLRSFRDNYLLRLESGRKIVNAYYETAPNIVKEIEKMPNKQEFYSFLYENYLKKIINQINIRDYENAINLYIECISFIQRKLNNSLII